MSAKNGDKARHEKNRKRVLHRRMKVREMLKPAGTESEAQAPKRRIKPAL
jgi:hypothetical protein